MSGSMILTRIPFHMSQRLVNMLLHRESLIVRLALGRKVTT